MMVRPFTETLDSRAMSNPWCRALGIDVPRLESVVGHREANTYSLMLVALLERGEPMTLAQIADRFAEVGVDDAEGAFRRFRHRTFPSRSTSSRPS